MKNIRRAPARHPSLPIPAEDVSVPAPSSSCVPAETKLIFHQSVVITVLPSLRRGTLAAAATGRRRVWEHGDREGSPSLLPAGHSEPPFPGSLYLTIWTHWPFPLPAPCLWSKPVFISGSLDHFWVWPMASPRED